MILPADKGRAIVVMDKAEYEEKVNNMLNDVHTYEKLHVGQNSHIMNWEASEIVEQESGKFKRWIQDSICIRPKTPTMNRDEGAYQLSPIWTQVISTPQPGWGRGWSLQSDFARLSQ